MKLLNQHIDQISKLCELNTVKTSGNKDKKL